VACVSCGRCREACDFDAIAPDYSTRHAACTSCQTCGGVCPTAAITFTGRWDREGEKPAGAPPVAGGLSRRDFLVVAAGGAAAVAAGVPLAGAAAGAGRPLVRPPGIAGEADLLARCERCGACIAACPSGVLRPAALRGGLGALWTPYADTDRAGCLPECTRCGRVCPTGAIRPLALEAKRRTPMGLAVVDISACLPHAGREDCGLCVSRCREAGYAAIEFRRVGVELNDLGEPIDDSGWLAPVVLADRCVGCGLCQVACRETNCTEKRLLEASAIVVTPQRDRVVGGGGAPPSDGRAQAVEVPYGLDLPDLPAEMPELPE
jgi:ferredoxin